MGIERITCLPAVLITTLLAFLLASTGGRASEISGAAGVVCVDGAHVVTVAGSYYYGIAGEYDHIVLERQAIGVCEPNVFLEDTPLLFEPVDQVGYASYTATVTVVPPRGDVVYRYLPRIVRPDGSRVSLIHFCDADSRSYALTDCDTAPFLRGRVEMEWDGWSAYVFRITACDGDCWTEPHFETLSQETLTALAGEPAFGLVGRVVDLFGPRTYCGMLGDPGHTLTRVARTVGDACGPVPAESVGWGAVKAMYR